MICPDWDTPVIATDSHAYVLMAVAHGFTAFYQLVAFFADCEAFFDSQEIILPLFRIGIPGAGASGLLSSNTPILSRAWKVQRESVTRFSPPSKGLD